MKIDKTLRKILLVEDEIDIQVIAKYALERVGKFTLKYCCSGKEALLKAEEFSPDLIILDVMMPVMDGVTTLQRLREIPALKETPVIFMTAKAQTSEISFYNELNILDVISKPFDAMTLSRKILDIWNERHVSASEGNDDELKRLFELYREHLPERVSTIESLWHALNSHSSQEQLMDFYRTVHNLSGSSGVYGYLDISAISDKLEMLLKSKLPSLPLVLSDGDLVLKYLDEVKHGVSTVNHEAAYEIYLKRNTKQQG